MRFLVNKVDILTTEFPTFTALIKPLSRVNPLVLIQGGHLTKKLPTFATLIWLFLCELSGIDSRWTFD